MLAVHEFKNQPSVGEKIALVSDAAGIRLQKESLREEPRTTKDGKQEHSKLVKVSPALKEQKQIVPATAAPLSAQVPLDPLIAASLPPLPATAGIPMPATQGPVNVGESNRGDSMLKAPGVPPGRPLGSRAAAE